jgi:glycosyltransferase involved in cell wall biosynthesis
VSQPLVSIIVPAYNAASYISDLIESVLGQTWANWELIVVDDGSTDETAAILANVRDPRIRIITQCNAGASAARNAGLDVASGEFVTFVDADDKLSPESLACRARYLQANPSVDIVNGRVRVTKDGETLSVYFPATSIEKLFPRLVELNELFFFGVIYFLRRSKVGAHRFPIGVGHCEDLCFFFELADRAGLKYGAVDAEVYEYRKHGSSAMSDLAGVELGYLALICRARQLSGMNPARMRALKCRISSIMIKTLLRRKKPFSAVLAALRIWVSISGNPQDVGNVR